MTLTPYPPFNPHSPIALLAYFTHGISKHALSENALVELSLPKLSLKKLSLKKLSLKRVSLKKLSLKKVSLRQLSSWGLFFGIFFLEGGLLTRIFFQDA